MNKYVKYPLVLGITALVSGALLSTTYHLTKETIEQGVIDRQTSAIDDLFTSIDSKELVEVKEEFKAKGVNTIVKVVSKGNTYNCYTITFKDGVGGDESTVIIALDSKGKVYGVKFVSTGDSYMAKYNNDTYLASVAKNDKFDSISGATVSGTNLNDALKLAKDCFGGKVSVDPMEELFGSSFTKKQITLLKDFDSSINKIYTVTSNNQNYYVFDTKFTDTIENDLLNVLYALNEDGTLFKIKVVSGDGYAKLYDGKDNLDLISEATYTGGDLETEFTKVSAAYTKITTIDQANFFTDVTLSESITVPSGYNKVKQILKVVSDETYYIFRVQFNDQVDGDYVVADYALKENGDLYKIKVIVGDDYASQYDNKTDLDAISDATYTGMDISSIYNQVKACLEEVK